MMMISRSKNKRKYKLFLVSGLILLIAGASIILLRDPLAGGLWRAGEPLSHLTGGVRSGLRSIGAQFASKARLMAENVRLREESASKDAVILERDLLRSENAQLKRRLGVQATSSALLAAVLLKPPATPYDTLVLDRGLEDGVREGDLVLVGALAIGTVTEVWSSASRATLLSAPGALYEAVVRTAQGDIPFTATGQGAGSVVGEVPAGSVVQQGDAVVFPGMDLAFLGRISHIGITEGRSFQKLYFHLPVNLFELRFVEIRRTAMFHEN